MLGAAIAELHLCAHGNKQPAFGLNIAHLRDVFEDDFVFGENGCGHAGKSGVFSAGNADGA